MSKRSRIAFSPLCLVIFVMLVGAAPSRATTMVALDERGLWSESPVVALVDTVSVEVKRAGGRVYTEAVLRVARALKGTKAGAELTLIVPGGELDGYVQRVHGAPAPVAGGSSLVFLSAMPGGRYQVTGWEQGWMTARPTPEVRGGWVLERSVTSRLLGDRRLSAREPLVDVIERLSRQEAR